MVLRDPRPRPDIRPTPEPEKPTRRGDITAHAALFTERRAGISAVHHALTGVWIGQHEPDDNGDLIISHPKLDDDVLQAVVSDARRIPDLTREGDLEAKVDVVRSERDKLRQARSGTDVRVVDDRRVRGI